MSEVEFRNRVLSLGSKETARGDSCPAHYRAYCRGYRRGLIHRYYGQNSRLVGHAVDDDELGQAVTRGYQDGLEGRECKDYEVVCGQPA